MQTAFSMLTVEEVDRNALDSRGAGGYDLETMEAMIDQCYKGQDQEGADVYYAVNTDGDYAGKLQRCDKEEFIDLVFEMEETVDSLYNLF